MHVVEGADAAETHVDVAHADGLGGSDRVHRKTSAKTVEEDGFRRGPDGGARRHPAASGMRYCMLCVILSVTGLW